MSDAHSTTRRQPVWRRAWSVRGRLLLIAACLLNAPASEILMSLVVRVNERSGLLSGRELHLLGVAVAVDSAVGVLVGVALGLHLGIRTALAAGTASAGGASSPPPMPVARPRH